MHSKSRRSSCDNSGTPLTRKPASTIKQLEAELNILLAGYGVEVPDDERHLVMCPPVAPILLHSMSSVRQVSCGLTTRRPRRRRCRRFHVPGYVRQGPLSAIKKLEAELEKLQAGYWGSARRRVSPDDVFTRHSYPTPQHVTWRQRRCRKFFVPGYVGQGPLSAIKQLEVELKNLRAGYGRGSARR